MFTRIRRLTRLSLKQITLSRTPDITNVLFGWTGVSGVPAAGGEAMRRQAWFGARWVGLPVIGVVGPITVLGVMLGACVSDHPDELFDDPLAIAERQQSLGGCPGLADPGDWNYCSDSCPCDMGEGDCDGDSECLPGLICATDVGASFGWDPEVDVCTGPCFPGERGGWDYCSAECPCDEGEGDCDDDSECLPGLDCQHNIGAQYGWDPGVDVCTCQSDCTCHSGPLGSGTYCRSDCPCDVGEGDCDSDSQCLPGLKCVEGAGPDYGWPAHISVCEDTCHPSRPGGWEYCSPDCPCGPGEGDCDSSADCLPGLTCVGQAGAEYGWHPAVGVCEHVSIVLTQAEVVSNMGEAERSHPPDRRSGRSNQR